MPPEDGLPQASMSVAELERIQNILSRHEPTFWKNYPLLVAAAGLLLSVITSAASTYTSYRRDIHDEQAQLASTIQAIQDLVLKAADLNAVKERSSYQNAALKIVISQENTMLHTGAGLALRLGTYATTSELLTLSEGLFTLGDFAKAAKLTTLAVSASDNVSDRAYALKSLGWLKLRSGSTIERAAGDALYERATSLEKETDLQASPYVTLLLKAGGTLNWADALALYDCASARQHFSVAQDLLRSAPHTPDFDQIREQSASFYAHGIGGVQACTPAPSAGP